MNTDIVNAIVVPITNIRVDSVLTSFTAIYYYYCDYSVSFQV